MALWPNSRMLALQLHVALWPNKVEGPVASSRCLGGVWLHLGVLAQHGSGRTLLAKTAKMVSRPQLRVY